MTITVHLWNVTVGFSTVFQVTSTSPGAGTTEFRTPAQSPLLPVQTGVGASASRDPPLTVESWELAKRGFLLTPWLPSLDNLSFVSLKWKHFSFSLLRDSE